MDAAVIKIPIASIGEHLFSFIALNYAGNIV